MAFQSILESAEKTTVWSSYIAALERWEVTARNIHQSLDAGIAQARSDEEADLYRAVKAAVDRYKAYLTGMVGTPLTTPQTSKNDYYLRITALFDEKYPAEPVTVAESSLTSVMFRRSIENLLAQRTAQVLASDVSKFYESLATALGTLSEHAISLHGYYNELRVAIAESVDGKSPLTADLQRVRTDIGTSFEKVLTRVLADGNEIKNDSDPKVQSVRALITNIENNLATLIDNRNVLYRYHSLLVDELKKLRDAGLLDENDVPQGLPNTRVGQQARVRFLPDLIAKRDQLGPRLAVNPVDLQATSFQLPQQAGLSSAFRRLFETAPRAVVSGNIRGNRTSESPDTDARLLLSLKPDLAENLFAAWRNLPPIPIRFAVYGFSDVAAPFGHDSLHEPRSDNPAILKTEDWTPAADESSNGIYLEREFDSAKQGEFVALQATVANGVDQDEETALEGISPFQIEGVAAVSRFAYRISGKSTHIRLHAPWWDHVTEKDLRKLRTSRVYIGNRSLELIEEPYTVPIGNIDRAVEGDADRQPPQAGGTQPDLLERAKNEIELTELYEGLDPGHVLIVEGERFDLPGVNVQEVVRLSSAVHIWREWPNERPHTTLKLRNDLEYAYKRDTVRVYANVVDATHGETHREIVGNGEASKLFQRLPLSKSGVSHLPANDGSPGTAELEVRVNDILWDRVANIAELGQQPQYLTRIDGHQMSLQFGDGMHGPRLPTGIENVRAIYRTGIGKSGNVRLGQISQLPQPVLGVQQVTNRVRSSGGVDPESVFQGRESVGRFSAAMGRLVSLSDYEDFARSFGGIAKAIARRSFDRGQPIIEVYVAAGDDAPIDPDSLLLVNLAKALMASTSSHLPIHVRARTLRVLVLEGDITVNRRFELEKVLTAVRTALLDYFSFERTFFGRDIPLSRVTAVIQQVPAVEHVIIPKFGSISEAVVQQAIDIRTTDQENPLDLKNVEHQTLLEVAISDIAYLTPQVPETIQLRGFYR
jgi:hypothetical protein